VQFSATNEHTGKRLDRSLHERFPEFSRARLQDWIKRGRVLVNGAPARSSRVLREGDRVDVEPAELPPLRAAPEAIPLRVLYEDQDIVAIDKPAGMVVHAGAGVNTGTLVNALLGRFQSLSALGAKEQACATFGEIPRRFPNASATIKSWAEREARRAQC